MKKLLSIVVSLTMSLSLFVTGSVFANENTLKEQKADEFIIQSDHFKISCTSQDKKMAWDVQEVL
ncbi:MAG: hypothetical protein RUMPE_00202 [Eubacteriales bacterium SKADARSKE-1]|nr:hypothetical protein [Eubacteriales bacterium SKADARSKE-1]